VSSNFLTSQKAIEIAKECNECYAAVGLHPIHVKDEDFDTNKYTAIIKTSIKYIKAIGETGLDFYHSDENKNEQIKVLRQHIELANRFALPLILHCRGSRENSKDAYLELLKILNSSESIVGVIHCFTSNWQIAQRFLKIGLYIGFTGVITFKNADKELLEVVENTPLDRILTETDCPYLSPEPHRGERNEPSNVLFTAKKIAEIKNIFLEEIDEITTTNAKKLFNLMLL